MTKWGPYFHIAAKRPWPEVVKMVRINTKETRRYVPERTCSYVYDLKDGCYHCSNCGYRIALVQLSGYCQECGARVGGE